jgi:FecR protein
LQLNKFTARIRACCQAGSFRIARSLFPSGCNIAKIAVYLTLVMKTKRLNYLCCGLAIAALSSILVGCPSSEQTATESSPTLSSPSPQTETVSKEQTAATLSEIQQQPVWVKQLNAAQEISGKEDMALQVGETLRTEGEALAQVDLSNGLAFRIGGDAVLTLQPDNQLNLNSGEMITWVEPGQKVPAEIVTPGGIAGIRGTTVYVKIPKNPEEGILFFSWEGKVAVRLPNQTEEILLESGQEVRIPKGETNLTKIRAAVRQLSHKEWQERRLKSRLINKFGKRLPTLSKIEEVEKKMSSPQSHNENPRQDR